MLLSEYEILRNLLKNIIFFIIKNVTTIDVHYDIVLRIQQGLFYNKSHKTLKKDLQDIFASRSLKKNDIFSALFANCGAKVPEVPSMDKLFYSSQSFLSH